MKLVNESLRRYSLPRLPGLYPRYASGRFVVSLRRPRAATRPNPPTRLCVFIVILRRCRQIGSAQQFSCLVEEEMIESSRINYREPKADHAVYVLGLDHNNKKNALKTYFTWQADVIRC